MFIPANCWSAVGCEQETTRIEPMGSWPWESGYAIQLRTWGAHIGDAVVAAAMKSHSQSGLGL